MEVGWYDGKKDVERKIKRMGTVVAKSMWVEIKEEKIKEILDVLLAEGLNEEEFWINVFFE